MELKNVYSLPFLLNMNIDWVSNSAFRSLCIKTLKNYALKKLMIERFNIREITTYTHQKNSCYTSLDFYAKFKFKNHFKDIWNWIS